MTAFFKYQPKRNVVVDIIVVVYLFIYFFFKPVYLFIGVSSVFMQNSFVSVFFGDVLSDPPELSRLRHVKNRLYDLSDILSPE